MKVYVICFNNSKIAYPKLFLNREKAEMRLRIIQDLIEMEAAEYMGRDTAHYYSVEEREVEE